MWGGPALGTTWVLQPRAQDLLVGALLVAHLERPDGARRETVLRGGAPAHGRRRVHGVGVPCQGSIDEPAVGRVLHGREQHPVEYG